MILDYTHCIHCNTKINDFNKDRFVEVISDCSTMEKDIVVKNVLRKEEKMSKEGRWINIKNN